MRFANLSQRLFLVAAVAALPSLLVPFLILWSVRNSVEEKLHSDALAQAQIAALELDLVVEATVAVMRAMANTRVVTEGEEWACDAYAGRVTADLPQLTRVAIFDAAGGVTCQGWPRNGIEAERPQPLDPVIDEGVVTGTYLPPTEGTPALLPISVPLPETAAWPGGTIVGWLNLQWLDERMRARALQDGGSITIADRDGTILVRQPQSGRFVGTRIPDAFLRLVNATAPGTEELVSQDGTRRVVGYVPVADKPRGLYISVGVAVAPEYSRATADVSGGIALAVVGSIAALVLAWLTSERYISRPFSKLLRTVESWKTGDLQARFGIEDRNDDFGRTGQALDAFIDQLSAARAARKVAEAQRETVARELDHRIKNLITTIQAIARQSLRGKGMDAALAVFSERLKAMAAAHDLLIADSFQSASVRELVWRAIGPFEDRTNPRFDLAGPEITANSRVAMALSMALHELATNAVKYGALKRKSGRVVITWTSADGSFRLTWTETGGPSVPPRLRTGFGSTMIEQVLAKQIGGDVEMRFEPDGLRFSLSVASRLLLPENADGEAVNLLEPAT
jgi:two-component sensor histidine kinase